MPEEFPLTYKVVWSGTLAAGASVEEEWTSDADYLIEKIFLIERTGKSLYKVMTTISVDTDYLTKDKVPASVFAPDEWLSPKIGRSFARAETFKMAMKNEDTVDFDIVVLLKLRHV